MVDYGTDANSIVDILNRSSYYYIAAVAVAIGFRMNLFNIGVDGQYQLSAMVAAAAGGGFLIRDLPGPVVTVLVVLIAVAVGAFWAGIAGLLKVTRGVSEVISTIMLNAIGAGFVGYLISERGVGVLPPGGNITTTRLLPEGSWVPGIRSSPGRAVTSSGSSSSPSPSASATGGRSVARGSASTCAPPEPTRLPRWRAAST